MVPLRCKSILSLNIYYITSVFTLLWLVCSANNPSFRLDAVRLSLVQKPLPGNKTQIQSYFSYPNCSLLALICPHPSLLGIPSRSPSLNIQRKPRAFNISLLMTGKPGAAALQRNGRCFLPFIAPPQ